MIGGIFATDTYLGFAKDGKIPWHVSEDFKFFRKMTDGGKILMGRKTFESLPRVLPNRHHIVITGDPNYNHQWTYDDNVEVIHSLSELNTNNLWVIGGPALLIEVGEVIGYDVVYHSTIKGDDYDCDVRLDVARIVGNLTNVAIMDLRDFKVDKYVNEDKF